MRKLLLAIFWWTGCLPLLGQSVDDIRWTGSYANQPLSTILTEIQAQQPVRFFFRPEWIADLTFSGSFRDAPLNEVMNQLLAPTELTYQRYQQHSVVLLQKNPNALTASLRRRGPDERLIVIGDSLSPGQKSATVSGYVREGATGQGITGATLLAQDAQLGTSTNINGYYSFVLPVGFHTLLINSLGFEGETQEVRVVSDGTFSIDLYEATARLEEITITDRAADDNVSSTQMSATRMDIRKVQKMPAFLGEVDLINAIELLPGVSVAGEGAAGFNVRGGDVGQNLILARRHSGVQPLAPVRVLLGLQRRPAQRRDALQGRHSGALRRSGGLGARTCRSRRATCAR